MRLAYLYIDKGLFMNQLIMDDREKLDISDGLPPLPPFLQPKRRPHGRYIIVPDISRGECRDRLSSYDNNWYTLVYRWMIRIEAESGQMEFAHTATRRYRAWLETYQTDTGIAPHIAFGGAIEAGEGDPTFHGRWIAYARELFV